MKNILLIDDEEKLRSLLARLIALEGYEVLQAPDCKSAFKKLEHLEETKPSACFMALVNMYA